MLGIIIVAGIAIAFFVMAISVTFASAIFGLSFGVVKATLPKKDLKVIVATLGIFGLVFFFVAYRYFSSQQTPKDVWESLILYYFSGISALLASALTSVIARIALYLMQGMKLSSIQKSVVSGASIIGGYVVSFVLLIAVNGMLSQKFAPAPPITLSFEPRFTHCVNASQMSFYAGPSTNYKKLITVNRGEKLRLSSPPSGGWNKFEADINGESVIVHGLGGNYIVPVRFCRA
ncbi:hypothetical protein LVO79_21030 (plasmid) [Roseivivax marinus]|uniref:hypothetical protein n=1 Tax=Roseivivax marinus TaxID=1379903 RepID=UPI001F035C4D|nr:hypothetical protein [Roseivivax marinus]UMA67266.1 hypothetical protein LVO79_21030 [Roseivivax marinus]